MLRNYVDVLLNHQTLRKEVSE